MFIRDSNYTLVSADDYVHIQGQERHTTDGGLRVKVNNKAESGNHYNIEVGANANCTVEVVSGDINLVSQQGDVNIKAGKNFNLDINKAYFICFVILEASWDKSSSSHFNSPQSCFRVLFIPTL